ncbi:MAG: hypothetical protein WBD99_08600 [Thermodesulfobacteriota bacterium]
MAGFHEFFKQTPRPATFKLDDRIVKDRFSLFFAFNIEAGGREAIVARDATVDDGLWDVVFCRELNKPHLLEVMTLMQKGDGSFLD